MDTSRVANEKLKRAADELVGFKETVSKLDIKVADLQTEIQRIKSGVVGSLESIAPSPELEEIKDILVLLNKRLDDYDIRLKAVELLQPNDTEELEKEALEVPEPSSEVDSEVPEAEETPGDSEAEGLLGTE